MESPSGQLQEMTCEELVRVITDYLEGALPAQDRARFEEHLATCRHCVAYVDQMRTTVRIVGTLRDDDLSGDELEDLLLTFQDWKRTVQ